MSRRRRFSLDAARLAPCARGLRWPHLQPCSHCRRGPLYYVIVLMAVTALYWRASPVGLIIASLMCGGDGLADIVGRRLGASNPLPWNPQKSWAGSAAMFLGERQRPPGPCPLHAALPPAPCPAWPLQLTRVKCVRTALPTCRCLPAGGLAMSLGLIALFSGLGYFEADMPAMGTTGEALGPRGGHRAACLLACRHLCTEQSG